MSQTVVATLTLVESGEKEEAENEVLADLGFFPSAPLPEVVAVYAAGTTYAKGALAEEGGQVYRSQAAANKGNEPKADTDFVHWAPVGTESYPLQNPNFFHTPSSRTQQAYNNTPPASSAATASALETIGVGAEEGLGQ